ncbi:MAG TPA: sigma-70 family RNA polymerase sigma factor [Candidatus Acidoferrales bacterium]|nr:sigma-70 family RNA polymerase sigma factor [Candidatus Acidoferrales bacterium]
MPAEDPADCLNKFLSTHARSVEGLLAKTEAPRWGLTRARFAEALHRSAEHRFRGTNPAAAEVTAYLESLHVEDLALACACSDGNEQAWDDFVRRYRDDLHLAARAITGGKGQSSSGGGDARAHDLADSLYAELYGLGQHASRRRSLFDYFHGRSKLSTWLRAILAQRHVDFLRASQRTEPLGDRQEAYVAETLRTHGSPVLPDPDRVRYLDTLRAALLEALAALAPRDRLRLAYYYVQERTLAEIGRILGEHEATASRNLERTRGALRKQVERTLRAEKRLTDAQVQLCFEYALEEWPFDLSGALGVAPGTGTGQPAAKLRDAGTKLREG